MSRDLRLTKHSGNGQKKRKQKPLASVTKNNIASVANANIRLIKVIDKRMKEKTAAQDKVLRTNQVKNWIDNDNVSPNLMCQFMDGGMYFVLGEGGVGD